MTEQSAPPLPPRELTVDELVPIAVALEHRRRQQRRGITLVLRPLPVCPDCGAAPEGLVTCEEPFRAERLVFRPCGHAFAGRVMDVYEAAERARGIVDEEENRPVGERREPPAELADRVAQSGVLTPGCDCGHEGMGRGWHASDCAWKRAAAAGDSLRDLYAAAVYKALRDYGEGDYDPGTGSDYGDQTAVVMEVRDAEVARLRAQVAGLEQQLALVRRFGTLYADSCHVVRAETGRDLLALLDGAAARLVVQPGADGSGR